jgi:hypothetical protein
LYYFWIRGKAVTSLDVELGVEKVDEAEVYVISSLKLFFNNFFIGFK